MSSANTIKKLFDFQKYEQNDRLEALIEDTMSRYPGVKRTGDTKRRLAPNITCVELTEEELELPAAGIALPEIDRSNKKDL